ncbi:MAG: hypothetical protein IKE00_02305 [Oscillospiraceae bacterium]|nr:hypothetical protein [Oscillospiraceae bacterium]
MKYGESTFDILYLLFAIVSGCVMLVRGRGRTEKEMGLAALILGVGDAFHLVPRVLNYFLTGDFTAALGIGKLVTSITMTVFYLLVYDIWAGCYHAEKKRTLTADMLPLWETVKKEKSLSTMEGAYLCPEGSIASKRRSKLYKE